MYSYADIFQGTWYFMSFPLLSGMRKGHTVHDDIESVFWILLYILLNNFKCNLVPGDYHVLALAYGETYMGGGGCEAGGVTKSYLVTYHKPIVFEGNTPLTDLVGEFREKVEEYHAWFSRFTRNKVGPEPPESILEPQQIQTIFSTVLNRPNEEWSNERFNKPLPLDEALINFHKGSISGRSAGSLVGNSGTKRRKSTGKSTRSRSERKKNME